MPQISLIPLSQKSKYALCLILIANVHQPTANRHDGGLGPSGRETTWLWEMAVEPNLREPTPIPYRSRPNYRPPTPSLARGLS